MASRRLRFGIKTSQMHSQYGEVLEAWRQADELGFETAWLHDHLMPPSGDHGGAQLEGWTLLATLLAQTSRVRGGLMVTGNSMRHPAMLAKIAATTDVIGRGRVEMGIGAGWMVEEHEQYDIPLYAPGERLRRLDEACRILKLMWTERRASFDGRHYHLRDTYCEPKPVQPGGPPVVIGGVGEKVTLRLVARHASEWNYNADKPDEFKRKLEVLSRHCQEQGRDPASVELSVNLLNTAMPPEEIVATARAYVAAGATHVILACPRPFSAANVRRVWDEIVPRIRG